MKSSSSLCVEIVKGSQNRGAADPIVNPVQPSRPDHTIRSNEVGTGHTVVGYDIELIVVAQGKTEMAPACELLGPFHGSLTVQGQHLGACGAEVINIVSQLHELPATRSSPMGS
mgnify:CR=1 FL=1